MRKTILVRTFLEGTFSGGEALPPKKNLSGWNTAKRWNCRLLVGRCNGQCSSYDGQVTKLYVISDKLRKIVSFWQGCAPNSDWWMWPTPEWNVIKGPGLSQKILSTYWPIRRLRAEGFSRQWWSTRLAARRTRTRRRLTFMATSCDWTCTRIVPVALTTSFTRSGVIAQKQSRGLSIERGVVKARVCSLGYVLVYRMW